MPYLILQVESYIRKGIQGKTTDIESPHTYLISLHVLIIDVYEYYPYHLPTIYYLDIDD